MPTRVIIAYILIVLMVVIPAVAIYRARTRIQRQKRAQNARIVRETAHAASSRPAESGRGVDGQSEAAA